MMMSAENKDGKAATPSLGTDIVSYEIRINNSGLILRQHLNEDVDTPELWPGKIIYIFAQTVNRGYRSISSCFVVVTVFCEVN